MPHKVMVTLLGSRPIAVPQVVSICEGCEVEWVAAAGVTSFKIDFSKNGSPFAETTFGDTNPRHRCNVVDPGPGNRKRFSYWLSVNGGKAIDPDVEVIGGP